MDFDWMSKKLEENGDVILQLEKERDALRAENERLRERLEIMPEHPEWDGIACRDETIRLLQQTSQEHPLCAEYRFRGLTPQTRWRPHDSHQPPADLAPAQLVDVTDRKGRITRLRADQVEWSQVVPYGGSYRPALSASGEYLCSAEGLDKDANYVATDANVTTWQFGAKPEWRERKHSLWVRGGAGILFGAPSTHRRPGPASESLMEVHRD